MEREFDVVIVTEPQAGYSVLVPELPSVATQGETIEEARANASLGQPVTKMPGPSTASPPVTLADGPLLRPDEAAHLLAVKTSWIYEAVRTGRLPCLRIGRHIRFTRAMLEGWLAEQVET